MAKVRIEVGGRLYDVACRDGGEERLQMLSHIVDARAADVVRSLGPGNESRELVLTALLLADELEEARAAAAVVEAHAAALEGCAARIEAIAMLADSTLDAQP